MNPQKQLNPEMLQAILHEAIKKRMPAMVTYRGPKGWAMIKSRLLGVEADSELILLELTNDFKAEADTYITESNVYNESNDSIDELQAESPASLESLETDDLKLGQSLGVSFRYGHRKCMFSTVMLGKSQRPQQDRNRCVLRVEWPEEVSELQQRLYHRTPVPYGRMIQVDLQLAQDDSSADTLPLPQRGRMLDLSAGGISVEIPRETRPRWRQDDQLLCRFATGSDRDLLEVSARIKHCSRTADGQVRLGLQFVGLDACEDGRQTLLQIRRMTNRFQRSGD